MKLKEYVDIYGAFFASDMELIRDYILRENLELEAIQMIGELAREKAQKDTHLLEMIKGNVAMLAMNNYRNWYSDEFADLLQRASFAIALGEDITARKELWEELKETVPKHELRKGGLIWRELHEILSKNNIKFNGE